MLSSILWLLLFVGWSQQQKNPLTDFCRRFGHQSTIIDRRLFIDGGLVNWNPISANPGNFTNTWLLYNDLDHLSPANFPQINANLSKNGSIPDVSGGILWEDILNRRFYLYGGEYYQTPLDSYNLLSYDAIYDKWDSFGPPDSLIETTSWGAGISVSEVGIGYYYGGWQNNSTTPGWGANSPAASSTLVTYSMDTNSWTANAGPDSIPRAEGVMVFIPASDAGLLVYFGGISTPYGNETMVGMNMSTIMLYDIAGTKWYNQTATGDVPDTRRRFCAAATWAADKSSYQIYLYGGLGVPPNGIGFDDVYILSLPSFIWIKYYPSTPGIGSPHHSLTCNIVDGAQMLVIGGTFPLSSDCDDLPTWGTHNLDLGRQNAQNATWYQYLPNITSYVVPPDVIQKIGGNGQGGATVRAPATWDNRDLPVYFTRTAGFAARTAAAGRSLPTSTPTPTATPTSSLPSGAIAGIAVGGSLALVLLLATCVFYMRRHKNRKADEELRRGASQNSSPQMMYTEPHSPYSPSSSHVPHSGNQWQPPVELVGSDAARRFPHGTSIEHVNVEPKYDRNIHSHDRSQDVLHARDTEHFISPAYEQSTQAFAHEREYEYSTPVQTPESAGSALVVTRAELSGHSRSPIQAPSIESPEASHKLLVGGTPLRRPPTRTHEYFR